MSKKIVGIHQPNYFPWLGYFKKIADTDVFVFLDHVTINPKTAEYIKRVAIIQNNNKTVLTVPVSTIKGQTFVPVNLIEINNPQFVAKKQLKSIVQAYGNHPFFNDVFTLVEEFYNDEEILLAKRNIKFISKICNLLKLDTELKISSDYNFKNSSTDLLIEICSTFSGTAYLSGDGAEGYQEDDKFKQANIQLKKLNFKHPKYEQHKSPSFLSGLSIIDCLFNIGIIETRKLLLTK